MNEIELRNVINIQYINFARNFARVNINDELKQIRFKSTKDEFGKIKLIVTKGIEHCIVSLDNY
jgi:hypothetical protein